MSSGVYESHRALFKYGRDNLHQNYVLLNAIFVQGNIWAEMYKLTDLDLIVMIFSIKNVVLLYLMVTIFCIKIKFYIQFDGHDILNKN